MLSRVRPCCCCCCLFVCLLLLCCSPKPFRLVCLINRINWFGRKLPGHNRVVGGYQENWGDSCFSRWSLETRLRFSLFVFSAPRSVFQVVPAMNKWTGTLFHTPSMTPCLLHQAVPMSPTYVKIKSPYSLINCTECFQVDGRDLPRLYYLSECIYKEQNVPRPTFLISQISNQLL